jgi:hypothetical protein
VFPHGRNASRRCGSVRPLTSSPTPTSAARPCPGESCRLTSGEPRPRPSRSPARVRISGRQCPHRQAEMSRSHTRQLGGGLLPAARPTMFLAKLVVLASGREKASWMR